MNLILHGADIDTAMLRAARNLVRSAPPMPHGRVDAGNMHAWRFADADGSTAARAELERWCRAHRLDAAWFDRIPALRDFALLVMDMDSTLVTIETVDEIADYCGRKAEVAAITEAAMRGEIADYAESLRRRVALLAGLDTAVLVRVYEERMKLSPGAQALVAGVHAAGLRTLLVSGGFTFFTERLKGSLGLSFAHANTLGVHGGRLTGEVVGEVVDADVKARTVAKTCEALGVVPARAIVMGDGANDLKMMGIAGLSVAYRAKPVVRAQATMAFDFCGLDGLLRVVDEHRMPA